MFTATVVGVVENVRQFGLEREPLPEIYFPYAPITSRPTYLVARAAGDPTALIPAVRQIVHELDNNLVVTATSMGDIVETVTESRRFSMLLVSLFAGTALFLVVAGTYGIMSYSVSQRIREVGVRVALGAGRSRLMLQFIGSGLRFAGWGIGFGLIAAIWGALVTRRLVYGVNPFDPRVILGGAVLMILVILAAIALPVYRASRVDPVEALRTE
jgi:ABC-type antimicrobial peptide transport system permease subunit